MSKHPAYAVWRSMLDRCRLPQHQAYANYGGRGIKVCARWQASFENFWQDMGPTYRSGLTLERKNNARGYSPKNCMWATRTAQARNKRGNRMIDTPKGKMLLSEASELSGIGTTTLLYRVAHRWPANRLFDAPDFRNRLTTS